MNVAYTLSTPTDTTMVKRTQKVGTSLKVLYNKYKGGVDYNDQLRGSCHVRLKCTKNYKYIFWYLLVGQMLASSIHLMSRVERSWTTNTFA